MKTSYDETKRWAYVTHMTLDPRLPLFSRAMLNRLGETGDEAKMNLECDGHKLCICIEIDIACLIILYEYYIYDCQN